MWRSCPGTVSLSDRSQPSYQKVLQRNREAVSDRGGGVLSGPRTVLLSAQGVDAAERGPGWDVNRNSNADEFSSLYPKYKGRRPASRTGSRGPA